VERVKMIFKRLISIVLSFLMLISFYGCTNKKKDENILQAPEGCVVDASGEVLPIPEKEVVTIASVYAVTVPFIVALGLSDNVVAINYKSIFWADNVEGLAKAGSVGRGIVDFEQLANFSPDVLIHRTYDPTTTQMVKEKLNIPVLTIKAETIEEIYNTLDILGEYCHATERAGQVKNWMNIKFNMISEIVSTIPEEEKKTAIVFGSELGVVAGGDMLQSWMLEAAGAVSLTSTMSGGIEGDIPRAWANIGTESIFNMNPDVIFCTSSTVLDYTVKQLLEDTTWSSIEAVKDNKVYHIPAKFDSWDLPGIGCVIGTMWMLHRLYPEKLSSEKLQNEIDDYYMFMFSKTFDRDYLGYEL